MTTRAVGPLTQAAIDADTYQRAVRVSVYDEAGVEIPIPGDLIVGFPRPESSLDDVAWRMSLSVLVTEETKGKILRGRTIKAWDVFAAGEDLELFTGKIADSKPATDYSSGVARSAWALECVGGLSSRFEALLTWYYWEPAPMNPDAANPYAPTSGEKIKLTGLVKTYRVTMVNPGITPTTTVTSTVDSLNFNVASVSGFSVGQDIFVFMGRGAGIPKASPENEPLVHKSTISAIAGSKITINSVSGDLGFYPHPGTVVTRHAIGIPITSMPFWPDQIYYQWVKVYNSAGVEMVSGWEACRSLISGPSGPVVMLAFTTDPGPTFTVEVMAVDRWVILRNRTYNASGVVSSTVPDYYLLSGVAGDTGSERINDPASTRLRSDKTHTKTIIHVEQPEGIFATGSPFFASLPSSVSTSRWISVLHGGVEYRGRVIAVDKNPASPSYGRVELSAPNALRSLADGSDFPSLGIGQSSEVISSTTAYYEALAHTVQPETYNGTGDTSGEWLYALRHEPYGGFFLLDSAREFSVFPVFAGGSPDTGAGIFTPYLGSTPIVIDYADKQPDNDVSEFFRQLFTDTGMASGDLSIADTSYTLAPFNQSQKTIGELVEDVRKNTIPPNYRLWEDEGGKVVGKYIVQASEPELILRGVRKFAPVEKPRAFTRVIVRGKQHEINRAGQLIARNTLGSPWYMFDGIKGDAAKASSVMDGGGTFSGSTYFAEAWFKIPKCEPGRYPLVTKAVFGVHILADSIVGGASTLGGAVRWLPRTQASTQVSQDFLTSTFSKGFEAVALGSAKVEDEWYLALRLKSRRSASMALVDEAEVYVKEGAYWESTLTDLTSEVPGDPAAGGSVPGSRWIQPDPTLAISHRYVPSEWLKRAQAVASEDLDRTITIENEGISQEQAREIAEATLDDQLRGAEFYECEATYDPRVTKGMSIGVPQDDGTIKTLLVWYILRDEKIMRLRLADYSI